MLILSPGISIINFEKCKKCKGSHGWNFCEDCLHFVEAMEKAQVKSRKDWEKEIAKDFFKLFFNNINQCEKSRRQLAAQKAKIFCDKYFKEN